MPKESEVTETRRAPDLAKLREAARKAPMGDDEIRKIAYSIFIHDLRYNHLPMSPEQISKAVMVTAEKAGITQTEAYQFLRAIHQIATQEAWGN